MQNEVPNPNIMDPTSPKKKSKSPQEGILNTKNCVTCMNVPESLFDVSAAKKHFSKFGRVHRIRLFPKREMCVIEYDQPESVEKALLNAGAFDGFMFDVTRTKPRVRKRSKKEDDPDWVADPEVQKELSAMSGEPSYRLPRQKPMELEVTSKSPIRTTKQIPVRKKVIAKEPIAAVVAAAAAASAAGGAGAEAAAVAGAAATSLSTAEAAAELAQLRARRSLTVDDQWRALDARDRILRAWGGTGARVRVGGATVGRCRDMCPEKERLQRMSEHQLMTLETDAAGGAAPALAVKQYSRSSADQEMPMCYELRPPETLARTCAYLLHEVADTKRQVALADWFHFMWDRFRGIRKDITQQALCCAESIRLVEMCARFHAHCAARLADLEYTQFDQKLNTENLAKCLQTLKHMYADVGPALRPNEAEFRGYIALLNLGDANFWWEIKQLPLEVQKSEPIAFSMKVYNALDNNNYVRFFRLVRERASYLQACVLLRYFNDVRARALARMIKAFAPRGGSRYPAHEVLNTLAFENPDSMRSFISHYGLRCAKVDDGELTVILDRNQFIEDSDPYPVAREIQLIESKRHCSVGEVIAGGALPDKSYENHTLHCSFNKDGTFKESSLLAEDLGYNTFNDTNKDVSSLKAEVFKLSSNYKNRTSEKPSDFKENVFSQPSIVSFSPKSTLKGANKNQNGPFGSNQFHFKPAIPVAPTDVIKNSPEKVFGADLNNSFSFSTPQHIPDKETTNLFKTDHVKPVLPNIFAKPSDDTKYESKSSQNLFKTISSGETNIFKKTDETTMPVQGSDKKENKLFTDRIGSGLFNNPRPNLFSSKTDNLVSGSNLFAKSLNDKEEKSGNIFAKPPINENLFAKASSENLENSGNIFSKPLVTETNIFSKIPNDKTGDSSNIFKKPQTTEAKPVQQSDPKSLFSGFKASGTISNIFSDTTSKSENLFSKSSEHGKVVISPGSLFKSVVKTTNGPNSEARSIFANKTKPGDETVAAGIFNSVNVQKQDVYDFKDDEDKKTAAEEEKRIEEERRLEEQRLEAIKKEQARLQAIQREQDIKQQEEAKRKQEELRRAEEERRKREEQRKQEELKKKLEEERKREESRKADEDKKFRDRVDKESSETVNELLCELMDEIVRQSIDDEIDAYNKLMIYAHEVGKDIISELCEEICEGELKAERFLTRKLISKWFVIWKTQLIRNTRRRMFLENTPVWISDKSPEEKAQSLKRMVENRTLQNMNAINKGYRFNGKPKLNPKALPYNIMEIIKSPLLKRMKQISYPYDKCFFWKVTLVSPGPLMWMNRKVEVENWLIEIFGDRRKHDVSETLIHVGKESWNNLMDFAISVSLTNMEAAGQWGEALEGSNAIIFYITEENKSIAETMNQILRQKFEYQVIPLVVIVSKEFPLLSNLEEYLTMLLDCKLICCYKIIEIEPQNVYDSMNLSTKSALKWLARKFPPVPGLEIDYLKSICERYLGNEIWHRLKYEKGDKFKDILKSVSDLVVIYNTAVDKLADILVNEDLFNYPTFPLEFKQYLSESCPYPKPSEYITSNARTSENISAIKSIMSQLKLPQPARAAGFAAASPAGVQAGIRDYCQQLGWRTDPEEIVCKVVAVLPDEFTNFNLSCEDFSRFFENYDMIDILNIIVYEKIKSLNNFDNRFAIYKKSQVDEYRKCMWWYELEVVMRAKQSITDCDDEIDYYIEAKRRKIAEDSLEYLQLEDTDRTMVDKSIVATDQQISNYNNCTATVHELETQLEMERLKSLQLENLLKAALAEV